MRQLRDATRSAVINAFDVLDKPEYFFALGSVPLINLVLTRHLFGNYWYMYEWICFTLWIIKFLFYPQKRYRYAWILCILADLICMVFLYASFIPGFPTYFYYLDPFPFIWVFEVLLSEYYWHVFNELCGLYKYLRIDNGLICTICHEDWEDTPNVSVVLVKCGHIFHAHCCNSWKGTCAVCRDPHKHTYLWKLHPYQRAILQCIIEKRFGYHCLQLYNMLKSNSMRLLSLTHYLIVVCINKIRNINSSNSIPININIDYSMIMSQQQQPLQYPIRNQNNNISLSHHNNNNNNSNSNSNSNDIHNISLVLNEGINNNNIRVKRKKKKVKRRNRVSKKSEKKKRKNNNSILLLDQNDNMNNNLRNELIMDDEKKCNDVLPSERIEYKNNSNNNNISFKNNRNIAKSNKKHKFNNKLLLPLHNQANALNPMDIKQESKPMHEPTISYNKSVEKKEYKQSYNYSSDSSSYSESINETKRDNMIQKEKEKSNNNNELLYNLYSSDSESLSDVIIENTKTTPGGPLKKEKKRCDKCTFDNEITAQKCEICNNSFDNINNKKRKRMKYWKCNKCEMKNENIILQCICGAHKPMKEWEQKRIIDINKDQWQCNKCYNYNPLNNAKCNTCHQPRVCVSVLNKQKKKKNKRKKVFNNVEQKSDLCKKKPKKESKTCNALYLRNKNVPPPPKRRPPVIPKRIHLKSNGISDKYDYDYSEEDSEYNQCNNQYNQYNQYNVHNKYNNKYNQFNEYNKYNQWNEYNRYNNEYNECNEINNIYNEYKYKYNEYNENSEYNNEYDEYNYSYPSQRSYSNYNKWTENEKYVNEREKDCTERNDMDCIDFRMDDILYCKNRKCQIVYVDKKHKPYSYTVKYLDDGKYEMTKDTYFSIRKPTN